MSLVLCAAQGRAPARRRATTTGGGRGLDLGYVNSGRRTMGRPREAVTPAGRATEADLLPYLRRSNRRRPTSKDQCSFSRGTSNSALLRSFASSTSVTLWSSMLIRRRVISSNRSVQPYYGFFILNRQGLEYVQEDLTVDSSVEPMGDIIAYESADKGEHPTAGGATIDKIADSATHLCRTDVRHLVLRTESSSINVREDGAVRSCGYLHRAIFQT